MKNNLFLISESEKSRILNMHKKATDSLYLSEQAAQPAAAQPAAAQPAQVPTDLKSVADIQNFLIGKGFDVGKTGADGKMGPSTIAALGKFMSGAGGGTPAAATQATGSQEASKTATAGTPAAGGTTPPAATQAAATPSAATQAAQAVTTATTAAKQTTNVPLASRKDIRQGNRQVRQDQRTLNRLGGRMTPEQQQAYQQSISNRTGIGTK
jgi:peptidoglycan hydrolase-like protein with peptidoglycan-binding domain